MKLTQIPKITYKQRAILDLIYTHRFLTRIQIQKLMKHKDKKTINLWLKELRAIDYVNWIYDKDDFINKTKPAIYYLGINGIRHFGNLNFHPDEELVNATENMNVVKVLLIVVFCWQMSA